MVGMRTIASSCKKAIADERLKIGLEIARINTGHRRQLLRRGPGRQPCYPQDESLTPGNAQFLRHTFRRLFQGSGELPDESKELQ